MKRQAIVKQPMIGLFHLPVVLVSCCDKTGKPNVIPVGWVGGVCSDPPQVGIALRPARYSHDLIQETGEFVVNIPCTEILKAVDGTGFCSGRKVDKFQRFGLTPLPADRVRPPLVKECPVHLECKLRHAIDLGSHTFFIGEILLVQADAEFLSETHEILYSKLNPIVLKHDEYCTMSQPLGFYGYTHYGERVVHKIF